MFGEEQAIPKMKPGSMAKCSKFLRERPSHINYHRETTT